MHLEDYEDGATFANINEGPYPLCISLILLVLDSIFYLLVAVYLDQVIPGTFLTKAGLWEDHPKILSPPGWWHLSPKFCGGRR